MSSLLGPSLYRWGPCTSVCRICLAVDVPTVMLSKTPLQEVFEKVTNALLNTDDMRPVEVCLFCRCQLRQCWKLMQTSEKAERILTVISATCNMIAKESIALIDRAAIGLCHSLSTSKFECFENRLPEKCEDIKVKTKLEKEDEGTLPTVDISDNDIDMRECDFDQDQENDLTLKTFSVADQDDSKITFSTIEAGSLPTVDVDISDDDIDMRECDFDQDQENDLTLKTFSVADQVDSKITFSTIEADADATAVQKLESKAENEIKQNSSKTNERESLTKVFKSYEKTKCNICKQWYRTKYIEQHLLTHTDIKPFKCKVCKNSFRRNHHLERHIERMHTSREKRPVVRKKAENESEIKQNSSETNERESSTKVFKSYKKTKCNICMTHTDIKPFKCKVCKNGFRQNHHLERHIERMHTSREKRSLVRNRTSTRSFVKRSE